MILLTNSCDSFTCNLAQHLGTFPGAQVLQNDNAALEAAVQAADALVLSPGPGWPADAGKLEEIVRLFARKESVLGICPGHQTIAEALDGKFGLAKDVMYDKQDDIGLLAESPILSNLTNELPIVRYHPTVVAEVPEELEIVAEIADDQEIMTIQHKNLLVYEFQFRPESIGSPDGLQMIENSVRLVVER